MRRRRRRRKLRVTCAVAVGSVDVAAAVAFLGHFVCVSLPQISRFPWGTISSRLVQW